MEREARRTFSLARHFLNITKVFMLLQCSLTLQSQQHTVFDGAIIRFYAVRVWGGVFNPWQKQSSIASPRQIK